MTSDIPSRIVGLLLTFTLIIGARGPSVNAASSPAPPRVASSAGPGWSPPQNISASVAVDSEAPALAVTASRVVHVVWEEDNELHHAYRTGGTWSTPAQVPGTGTADEPALAPGPGEHVQLVYANYPDIYRVAWHGSGWGFPYNVSQHDLNVSVSPDIAVASDGSVHIAAVEVFSQQLYHADVSEGTYLPIANAYGEDPSLDVAGMPSETIQIAYRHAFESDIYTLQRADGPWTLPESVSNTPESFSTAPQLVMQDSDTAHIVWRETISATPQVQVARGSGWMPVITLSQSTAGTSIPALALSAPGAPHAAWGDGDSPSFTLMHTQASGPDAWVGPEPVRTVSLPVDDVALFGSSDGTIHAVWVEGTPGEIWYARWSPCRVFLPLVLRN